MIFVEGWIGKENGMAVKFKAMRVGHSSDRCPVTGCCGVVISGDDGESNTAVTVHCKEAHKHGKACAKTLLDSPVVESGTRDEEYEEDELNDTGVAVKVKKIRKVPAFVSPREHISKVLADRRAAKAAEAVHEVEPMPKKEVIVKEGGKNVKKMVDDLDLE